MDCWNENGGWSGGGGLSGLDNPNTGTGSGGSDGGRVGGGGYEGPADETAPSGHGWAPAGGSDPTSTTPCGGTDAVYDDYAVITVDCGQKPDESTDETPTNPAVDDSWLSPTRQACEQRRDFVCDVFGLGMATEIGPGGGLIAKHICRKVYTEVCKTYEP